MRAITLPLDPTGLSPANLRPNESVSTVPRHIKTIVLEYGVFFGESLTLSDAATGLPLVRGTDYQLTDLYKVPSLLYEADLYGSIMIDNPTVSPNLIATYQALGGQYSVSNRAIVENVNALSLDDRPVLWEDIVAKPDRFNPAPHLTESQDLYGMEYIVARIDRIHDAILVGDSASHVEIYGDIDSMNAELEAQIESIREDFNLHVSNFNNPHHTTAAQISVYTIVQVNNILNNLQTVLTNRYNAAKAAIDNHIANKNNPHNVTAAQLDSYTKAEFDAIIAGFKVQLAAGANGSWDIVYSGGPGSPTAYTNSSNKAEFISVSVTGQGAGGVMNTISVGGVLIADAKNLQQGDPKCIQGFAYVPAGQTLLCYTEDSQFIDLGDGNGYTIQTASAANIYIARWRWQ